MTPEETADAIAANNAKIISGELVQDAVRRERAAQYPPETTGAMLARLRTYAENLAHGDMPAFTPAAVNQIGRNILRILEGTP